MWRRVIKLDMDTKDSHYRCHLSRDLKEVRAGHKDTWDSGYILNALHTSLLMDQMYDVKKTRGIKDDSWICGLRNYTTKMQLPLAQVSKTLGFRREAQF